MGLILGNTCYGTMVATFFIITMELHLQELRHPIAHITLLTIT